MSTRARSTSAVVRRSGARFIWRESVARRNEPPAGRACERRAPAARRSPHIPRAGSARAGRRGGRPPTRRRLTPSASRHAAARPERRPQPRGLPRARPPRRRGPPQGPRRWHSRPRLRLLLRLTAATRGPHGVHAEQPGQDHAEAEAQAETEADRVPVSHAAQCRERESGPAASARSRDPADHERGGCTMRKRTSVVALVVGAFAVLAIGSHATADSGKKRRRRNDERLLEGARAGLLHGGDRVVRGDDQPRRASSTRSEYSGLESNVAQAHIHFAPAERQWRRSLRGCAGAAPTSPGPAGTPACPGAGRNDRRAREAADVVGPVGQGILAGEFARARRSAASGERIRERPLGDLPRRRDSRPDQRPHPRDDRFTGEGPGGRPDPSAARSRAMTASPNSAARAPSTTRWSNVTAIVPVRRTTTWPSRTTGRWAMRPMLRIATSG